MSETITEIKKMLGQRCAHESEYNLSSFERWFYTFKAIICTIVHREPSGKVGYEDSITVATLAGGQSYNPSEPTCYWWEEIRVGYGFFRNWWAYWNSDST